MPPNYQHRVLFWGILGALVMRAVMIFAGVALIERFHWIIYVFGAFLIFTGREDGPAARRGGAPRGQPGDRAGPAVRPGASDHKHEDQLFIREGRAAAWPRRSSCRARLVEITDLIFAVDSIPAIFAVTQDPFIVYTSNVFAILGLRSLYFVLGGVMDMFHYLKLGLGAVLTFVGVKMLLGHTAWKIETLPALGVVAAILAASIVASLVHASRSRRQNEFPGGN